MIASSLFRQENAILCLFTNCLSLNTGAFPSLPILLLFLLFQVPFLYLLALIMSVANDTGASKIHFFGSNTREYCLGFRKQENEQQKQNCQFRTLEFLQVHECAQISVKALKQ